MPTPRYSSIWDRLTGDETNFTQADFQTWGEDPLNYPSVFEIVDGTHTYPFKNAWLWGINNWTWARTLYLWISPEGGVNAQQGREAFSLSDHEALQMEDLRQWIIAPPQTVAELDRFHVVISYTGLIEQRHPLVTKTFYYNKFGIRDDVPSG